MSEQQNKPDPIDDLKQGFGLLFRAARGAAAKLPTEKLEEVVKQGAREVGRVVGSVATTVDREVFGKKNVSASTPPASAPSVGGTPVAPGVPPATASTAAPASPTTSTPGAGG